MVDFKEPSNTSAELHPEVTFGLVAHRLLIGAHKRPNLVGDETLFDRQQHDLRA